MCRFSRHVACSLSSFAPSGILRPALLTWRPRGVSTGRAQGYLVRVERQEQSVWLTRMRWRLRGAWLWPAFIVADARRGGRAAVLPIAGDGPGGVLPGVLLAGFANLILIAAVAPLAGHRLRRRRPDLPRVVAQDYAGTALLLAFAAAVLAGGLIHRPAVVAAEEDLRAQAAAVHDYVITQEPEYAAGDRARRPDAGPGRPLSHLRAGPGPEALALPLRRHEAAAGGRDARRRPHAEHDPEELEREAEGFSRYSRIRARNSAASAP